jgi:hypothetical protein
MKTSLEVSMSSLDASAKVELYKRHIVPGAMRLEYDDTNDGDLDAEWLCLNSASCPKCP